MPEWGRLNRGTLPLVPHLGTLTPHSRRKLDVPHTHAAGSSWTLTLPRPTLEDVSATGGGRGRGVGEGEMMADAFDEILEDELTEADLDELEALGAAEDAARILGEIDA